MTKRWKVQCCFARNIVILRRGQEKQLKDFAAVLCDMKSDTEVLSNSFLGSSENLLDFASTGENKSSPVAPNVAEDRNDITPSASLPKSDKEHVIYLRNLPTDKVAKALDYTGEIHTDENAIDLTKRVMGKPFNDAIKWLDQNFGQQ